MKTLCKWFGHKWIGPYGSRQCKRCKSIENYPKEEHKCEDVSNEETKGIFKMRIVNFGPRSYKIEYSTNGILYNELYGLPYTAELFINEPFDWHTRTELQVQIFLTVGEAKKVASVIHSINDVKNIESKAESILNAINKKRKEIFESKKVHIDLL